MDFKKIDNSYRPIPFWSWNERLDTEETRRQVRLMKEAGIGGYFMHARGGLLTEYMGDEWFDNVNAATDEGEKCGMRSWAYDENGWPSGFANGIILALGEDYQLKTLVYKPTSEFSGDPSHVILERDGYTYYYEVNDLYVDLLNPAVTDRFIKEVHEVYKEKCGDAIEGFFTDEPQLLRTPGFPWSIITVSEFKQRYGYDLVDNIPKLFFKSEGCEQVRFDFWKMTTDLFSKNFFKKIYDWCEENGYKLTGHLVCEEVMEDIIPTTGSDMAHYEYFHIPGIDWLGRQAERYLTANQVGSVAAQMGQKYVLSESFALTGHNVSHAELKRIFEWQMVHGINLCCPHLEGYSNRGLRKRDYPVAMYYQEPWWDDVKIFYDTLSRTGMLLGEGAQTPDTLLIHSLSTAWTVYDGYIENHNSAREIRNHTNKLLARIADLERKHILFDLGDETVMERHAKVEGGKLVIGKMKYSRVILPEHTILFESTKRLLAEFTAAGGEITTVDALAPNPVTEVNELRYTMRTYPDFKLHYFINPENTEIKASITVGDLTLDATTGETSDFYGEHTFGPYESLMVIETGAKRREKPAKKEEKNLSLLGEWQLKSATENSLTLDRCDYWFDGELIAENGYVLDIIHRINPLRRPVRLRQRYTFFVEELPRGEMFLVTETPEIFDIKLNGRCVDKKDCGDFRDISFRRLNITDLVEKGENVIELESVVVQTEATHAHLAKSWTFETMTNSLSYDMEIEPIYIVGSFCVKTLTETFEVGSGAYKVKKAKGGSYAFAITSLPGSVRAEAIDASGFPQFAGALTLKKTFKLPDTAYRVKLFGNGINSVHITVNGKHVGAKMFGPYDVSISDYLTVGENEIELTLINNLRNMQGPLHLAEGETIWTNRNSFYRESNVFRHAHGKGECDHDVLDIWDGENEVCLVHVGLSEDEGSSHAPYTPWH